MEKKDRQSITDREIEERRQGQGTKEEVKKKIDQAWPVDPRIDRRRTR